MAFSTTQYCRYFRIKALLKNEAILSIEMLEGFYFETETRSFEPNINSFIFLMFVTYSTVIETVLKGVMLLI